MSSAAGENFEVVFPVLALIDPSETLGIGPFEHKKSDFFRLRRAKSQILLSLSQVTLEISDVSRNRGGVDPFDPS